MFLSSFIKTTKVGWGGGNTVEPLVVEPQAASRWTIVAAPPLNTFLTYKKLSLGLSKIEILKESTTLLRWKKKK